MKKLLLAVLAVFLMSSIATAATTLDMSGYFRVYPEISNANYKPGGQTVFPTNGERPTYAFTTQRVRLYFNVKSDESVGGTVAMEIDSVWGKNQGTVGRSDEGGALGADSNNIEIKSAYLWFKTGSLYVKAGIQTFGDQNFYVGGGDMAGFLANYNISKNSSLAVGAFTWYDRDYQRTDSVAFIPVSVKQKLGAGEARLFFDTIWDNSGYQTITSTVTTTSTGTVTGTESAAGQPVSVTSGNLPAPITSGYGWRPDPTAKGGALTTQTTGNVKYDSMRAHFAGLQYKGKAGNVGYDLYGFYNFGKFTGVGGTSAAPWGPDADISAFGLQAKVDVKLGDGLLKLRGAYASGGDSTSNDKFNGIVSASNYAGANTNLFGQAEDIIILVPGVDVINNAQSLVIDQNMNGDGLTMVYAAYNHSLSKQLSAQAVAGYVRANEKNNAAAKGRDMGTEFNTSVGYKLSPNMTISGIAAYAIVGDYFNTATTDQDNIYKFVLKFKYNF